MAAQFVASRPGADTRAAAVDSQARPQYTGRLSNAGDRSQFGQRKRVGIRMIRNT